MNPLRLACALRPERALPGLLLAARLRRMLPGVEIRYPPGALARSMTAWAPDLHAPEPALAAPDGAWPQGCDALLLPEWDAASAAEAQHALRLGIPVLCAAPPPPDAMPGVRFVAPDGCMEALAAALAEALEELVRPTAPRPIDPAVSPAPDDDPVPSAAARPSRMATVALPRPRLWRSWQPLSPRWREPEAAPLGIGLVTCNRLPQLRWLVESLLAFTRTPFHLVIADDGSQDGTAAWARESGIPVVTGRRRGVAWNKNRALYWLMHRTRSERLLLIEDDIYPVREGWEEGWLRALDHFPHVNYCPPDETAGRHPAPGSNGGCRVVNWLSAQLMGMTRDAVERVGFFDPRFEGYGEEHVEYTRRCARAGLHPPSGFLTLHDGSLSDHRRSLRDAERLEDIVRNRALMEALSCEPVWRPPALGRRQAETLAHEQARAAWPFEREEPGAERVSVICPTRTESLARRMAASLGEDPHVEFVWAWNGPGHPSLPGRVVEYRERPFNYGEACNRAARYASGRVLLFVNDDVEWTCRGLPAFLLELYARRPDLGIVYGGLPGAWEVLDAPEAPHWQGCCWAISRRAFRAMGGLEESLTGYGGDEFVSMLRMLRLGFRGARIAGWTYRHPGHRTYGRLPEVPRNRRAFIVALGWEPDPPEGGAWDIPDVVETILRGEGYGHLAHPWQPGGAAPGAPAGSAAAAPAGSATGLRQERQGSRFQAETRSASRFHEPSAAPAGSRFAARMADGAATAGSGIPAVPRRRWREPEAAPLGIGLVTCNRLPQLRWLVESLLAFTRTPFHLVIADDGSQDGTAAWARESGIPVVTGRRRGVAWNKNRALYWLMHRTRSERLLLIEDDVYPVREGWEEGWLRALDHFPHLCYSPEGANGPERLVAHYDGFPAYDWVGGALMAMRRSVVDTVGYLDTRFRGYGEDHVEYTRRCQRAGLTPSPGYVTLRDGSLSGHPRIIVTGERWHECMENRALRQRLEAEPLWRPPAHALEEQAFLDEQEAARVALDGAVSGRAARTRSGTSRRPASAR